MQTVRATKRLGLLSIAHDRSTKNMCIPHMFYICKACVEDPQPTRFLPAIIMIFGIATAMLGAIELHAVDCLRILASL